MIRKVLHRNMAVVAQVQNMAVVGSGHRIWQLLAQGTEYGSC